MFFIRLLLSTFLQSFTSMFFLLILLITYWNVKSNAAFEESWLGFMRNTVSNEFLDTVLFGMIAGLLASGIIAVLGITLDYHSLLFIWPIALILMLINQRYLCFSYAGGLVSLVSLLFGWPKIDVSAVIALVGILHFMESVLIYLNGYRDSIPVFLEYGRFKPIGAHVMRKLWPIPLVILVVPDAGMHLTSMGGIDMPSWWPLFQHGGAQGTLLFLPIMALLGYADVAITKTPKEEARATGSWLAFYSIIIICLSVVSSRIYWVKYLAAACAPIFHELLIIFGKRRKELNKPIFGVPWRGIRVLDVFPESYGESMGIRQGDIVLNINGYQVNTVEGVEKALSDVPCFVWLDIRRGKNILTLEAKDYKDGIEDLGVLFVPRQTGKYFILDDKQGIIVTAFKKLFARLKRGRTA